MTCPSLENLLAHVEAASLSMSAKHRKAAANPVAAHLAAGCGRCAADVEWYSRVVAITANDDTLEPPPWVVKRALRLFESKASKAQSASSKVFDRLSGKLSEKTGRHSNASLGARLGRVVAALLFDSAARVTPAGARGAGAVSCEANEASWAAAGRQLLYRADAYHIDLQFAADEDLRAAIHGQILRDGEFEFESVADLQLCLLRDGQSVLSTRTNEFGEFALSQLTPGQYDLQIEANEISITVVALPVA